MTSRIRQLLERFYPSDNAHKVIMGGLDLSGKTTLLYRMHTVVKDVKTDAFWINYETGRLRGRKLTVDIDAWGVGGGCGSPIHAIRIMRVAAPNPKGLIWLVDSADKERIAESAETLQLVLASSEELAVNTRYRGTPPPMEAHRPILILGTKADLAGASLEEITEAFSKVTAGRPVRVAKISTKAGTELVGMEGVFDWFEAALQGTSVADSSAASDARVPVTPSTVPVNPRDPAVAADRIREWLERTEKDMSPEEFIAKFDACDLPSWDHYTHIRIAYLLLSAFGRKKGKDMIFEGLEKYIKTNPHTRSRAFHLTMTYFWIQFVHFGMQTVATDQESESKSAADRADSHKPNDTPAVQYPSEEDFFKFLVVNPHLSDGSLWLDYYSKEVMMSAEAKAGMVFPDKKPLPNLVARDAV